MPFDGLPLLLFKYERHHTVTNLLYAIHTPHAHNKSEAKLEFCGVQWLTCVFDMANWAYRCIKGNAQRGAKVFTFFFVTDGTAHACVAEIMVDGAV